MKFCLDGTFERPSLAVEGHTNFINVEYAAWVADVVAICNILNSCNVLADDCRGYSVQELLLDQAHTDRSKIPR